MPLTYWNIIISRRYIWGLLLLTKCLSCCRVYNRYCPSNYWNPGLLLLKMGRLLVIIYCAVIITRIIIIAWIATTTTTNTTYAAITARWASILICNPLSHWWSICFYRILLMHGYRHRGHIAWINNRDSSCTWRCYRWILMTVMLGCNVIRWWWGMIWWWVWRSTFLNSFPMFGNLIFFWGGEWLIF